MRAFEDRRSKANRELRESLHLLKTALEIKKQISHKWKEIEPNEIIFKLENQTNLDIKRRKIIF